MLPDGLPLNGLEHFIQQLHDQCQATGVFTAVARFAGHVSPQQLERSLQAIQQRHPLLRASLIPDGRSWKYQVAPTAPPVPIEWIDSSDPERWRSELVVRSRKGFQSSTAPFLRLAVIQGADSDWCDLLFTMHHLIADGRSLLTILRDLQSVWQTAATTTPTLEPLPWVPPQVPPPPRPAGRWWQRLRAFRQQRRQLRSLPPVDFTAVPSTGMICRREVLTPEETMRLRGSCREAQTTLYGALAAAVLQSLGSQPPYAAHRFVIDSPVDFRTLCEPRLSAEQLGCYVWIMRYQALRPEQSPFWELAQRCRSDLETARQSGSFQRGWHQLPRLSRWVSARRAERLRRRIEKGLVSINDLGAVRTVASGTDLVLKEFGWYSNREHTVPTFVTNAVLVEGRLNLTFSSPFHDENGLAAAAANVRKRLTTQLPDSPPALS